MSIRADVSVADNLDARRTRTKLTMFNRLATFVIVFVTVGLMLLSIPGVRDIGLTLVASAGLAGLALGAADVTPSFPPAGIRAEPFCCA
jgi:small-conductance mechanosensitive channel